RRRLEQLLQAQEHAGGPSDDFPSTKPVGRPSAEQPGDGESRPMTVARDQSKARTSTEQSSDRIHDYQLLEKIGVGGMGVVYRGRDMRLKRDVAVKFLREDYRDDPTARARFLAEAQITGQLQHPGIPAIHELGTLPDGRPFLAMKLVKGQTLHE